MENKREIQDIFFQQLDDIRKKNYPKHVLKAAEDIANCRTNAMHGHLFQCPQKHFTAFLRNSCNNRFCPKCQTHHKLNWIDNTKNMILNTGHHHIVMKLPSFCYPFFLKHYRNFVTILFQSAKLTIEKIIKYSGYSNNVPGIIFALHTYGEENQMHPHLHVLITAGGLDRKKAIWNQFHNLFDIDSFSTIYTTIIRKKIMRQAKANPDFDTNFFLDLRQMQKQDLFISQKYDNPEPVIKYLAKTFRGTSIQNQHIVECSDGKVTFSMDGTHNTQLTDQEFVRRYLIHVLPKNQKSIRYAGLYSHASRKLLSQAKELLPEHTHQVSDNTDVNDEKINTLESLNVQIHKTCPVCKRKMIPIEKVLPFQVPAFILWKFGKDPPIEELFTKRAA